MPTLAIVGAGPGLGLAIARTFGARGYDVALIARNREKLDDLTAVLAEGNITAAAFPADVRDSEALTQALKDAAARFDGIDVLEYSPAVHTPDSGFTMTTPSESTLTDFQQQFEFNLYGAVTAARAVLPAMREAGSGTLLFTTGAGSINPVPMFGNVNAAAAALRNWVINLHNELAGSGVYAGHVAIGAFIGDGAGFEGFPSATPEQIAPVYWDLHTTRDTPERLFNG
jgi:NAD(P)-dependent dehydrogenase (short-subunit alcohol dehydrogenase family)